MGLVGTVDVVEIAVEVEAEVSVVVVGMEKVADLVVVAVAVVDWSNDLCFMN